MARILIIRFSALGDVAMTVPVVVSLARQYPQHEVVVLSRRAWAPLFRGVAANVRFAGADLKGEHRGVRGLNRLYGELKALRPDAVADFHHVLRSEYLAVRFRLAGVPVASIRKGRAEKKALTRARGKMLKPLEDSFHRYADVLARLGYPVELQFRSICPQGHAAPPEVLALAGSRHVGVKWIGIAPFARHAGKVYPLELQEQVVAHFAARPDAEVFLFGGGAEEQAVLDGWAARYPGVHSVAGKADLRTELSFIGQLDVMLSMDSANMHLASIAGVPVVSVLGATHPYAGFMGWGQQPDNAVQLDMPCRPCSVFGQKPCLRGDYACLRNIPPVRIVEAVERVAWGTGKEGRTMQ